MRVIKWRFKKIVGKGLFRCFIHVFVSICCILYHFQRWMMLNATLWFTLTHTFKSNGPKLANWSNSICITLWSCFCSLLTSNWKVSTGRLHYSFDCLFQCFIFFSMLHLCVCLNLLQFMSLLTINAVERHIVAYCHACI